jgi:hypothetical protein
LRERAARAEVGWESGSDEEDTLTGDFCGALRTDWVSTAGDRGLWFWRVRYKKFRGRGRGALEKALGADGIFEIEARPDGQEVVTKGVLFQAKKDRGSSRRDLREQVRQMETVVPGGSAVFEFGPNGYKAASGADMLPDLQIGTRTLPHPRNTMGEYLADQFLPCRSGKRGMYYDAVRQLLIVPADGTNRVVPAAVAHRVRLEVLYQARFQELREES